MRRAGCVLVSIISITAFISASLEQHAFLLCFCHSEPLPIPGLHKPREACVRMDRENSQPQPSANPGEAAIGTQPSVTSCISSHPWRTQNVICGVGETFQGLMGWMINSVTAEARSRAPLWEGRTITDDRTAGKR